MPPRNRKIVTPEPPGDPEPELTQAAKAYTPRVEPDDEGYDVLWRHWQINGNPRHFLFGVQGFIALPDNDIIAFIKDGPPRGPNAYYESSSFSKKA